MLEESTVYSCYQLNRLTDQYITLFLFTLYLGVM